MIFKRWSFGLGSIFSLIVVYFIYLYSRQQGWALLAFFAKWYLIIIGGLLALSLGVILLVLLISLLFLLFAALKLKGSGKKARKSKDYIDAEFEVKE